MISAIVISLNEENMIKGCLESLRWVDEIIVADNGSEDNTVKIARQYTDKVFVFKGRDFAALRNKAAEQAKGDWILYVDADERVLTPLKEEILQLVSSPGKVAFAISRRNIIFGREQKYKAFWPDWVIRLLPKSDLETWVGKIHEYPKFKGKLGYTKNSLLHLTHRDLNQIVLKSLDWSNIDAKLRLESGHPKMTGIRFVRVLISEAYNQGIKRRGFFSGTIGVMDAILQTFSMVITYIRLWQLQQSKPLDQIYQEIDENLLKNNFDY